MHSPKTHSSVRKEFMRHLYSRIIMFGCFAAFALGFSSVIGVNPASAASWSPYMQIAPNPVKGIAAASCQNSLDVFAIGTDDALYHNSQSGIFFPIGNWSGYGPVAPKPIKRVAATSTQCGVYDVFVMGTDNTLYHKHYTNGVWSGYEQLGSNQIKGVAATSLSSGRLDVFVIGTDDALYHKQYVNGVWSGYEQLGSNQIKAVAATWVSSNHLDVFVIGSNDSLYHKQYVNGGWSGYEPVGSETEFPITGVAAASLGGGRSDVFVIRRDDNTVYHQSNPNGVWTGYESLGRVNKVKSIAATSTFAGWLDLFAIGTNDAVWQKSYR